MEENDPIWYLITDARIRSPLVYVHVMRCWDTIPFGTCTYYMMLGHGPIWYINLVYDVRIRFHLVHVPSL